MAETAERERTQTILEAFDLTSESGDLLTGDVEEALEDVRQFLRRSNVPHQTTRLRVIRQGFDSWLVGLNQYVPDGQQLRLAMDHESATSQALRAIVQVATQLSNLSEVNIAAIEKHLTAIDQQVRTLACLFPEARLQRRVSGSYAYPTLRPIGRAPTWARHPYISEDFPSGQTGSPPPYGESSRSSNYAYERHANPRQAPYPNRTDSEPRTRRRVDRVDTPSGTVIGGNWYQTAEVAAAGANDPGLDIGHVTISGTGAGILGNVYGPRNPLERTTSDPRRREAGPY